MSLQTCVAAGDAEHEREGVFPQVGLCRRHPRPGTRLNLLIRKHSAGAIRLSLTHSLSHSLCRCAQPHRTTYKYQSRTRNLHLARCEFAPAAAGEQLKQNSGDAGSSTAEPPLKLG